jgi:hypothetical protein
MTKKFTIAFLLTCNLVWAQGSPGVQREDPAYTSSGNMIVFRAVPKDKTIKLYLIGKESAEVNFEKDSKLLSVSLLEKGGKSRNLEFKPSPKGYYEISGAPTTGKYDLELKAEVLSKPDAAVISIGKP